MTLAPHLPLPFLSRGGAVRRPPDATHLHLGKAFSLRAEARVKGPVNFLLQMICNKQTPSGRVKRRPCDMGTADSTGGTRPVSCEVLAFESHAASRAPTRTRQLR